jgi:hypothetical protein
MKEPVLDVTPEWGIDWAGPDGAATEANELLATISPPSDTLHWLHCYYEPGERWQPVERLIVAEMIPRTILAGKDAFFRLMGELDGDSLFAELEGPNPRESGKWDNVLQQFITRDGLLPAGITQRQWWLWRSHHAYARAFWIIQGSRGGHKKVFSKLERKILRFNGLPHRAPWAGELPFSRFDVRILDKLKAMDRLQDWMDKRQAGWETRTAADRAVAKAEAEAEIDSNILDWLDSQVADIAA